MLISEEYRELNRQKHALGSYGISGNRWAKVADSLARQVEAKTVLDYGCGQGFFKKKLEEKYAPLPYDVIEYDPAVDGKEYKPLRADFVMCSDVLEHIEPGCLYAVLDDIRNIARSAALLVVSTKPANKYLADGRNAHLIVEPGHWWLPKLTDRWKLMMYQDCGGEFMAWVAPKL